MSQRMFAAAAAASTSTRGSKYTSGKTLHRAVSSSSASDSDEEFFPSASSATNAAASSKRKRECDDTPSPSLCVSGSSSGSQLPPSFPCLSDVTLRAPAGFRAAGSYRFSLADESRDRGSAKLAILHIELSHPALRAGKSSSRCFVSTFKIDGRKSFSNAPYKRYYSRAIHAAFFARSTSAASAEMPAPNSIEPTICRVADGGRLLCILSQRQGRAGGKAFTGLLHDSTSESAKHPLLCLASNSVEYTLQVFVNTTHEQLKGEAPGVSATAWQEAEAHVTGRFDAGQVTLECISGAASSSSFAHAAAAASPAPVRKQARTTAASHVRSAAVEESEPEYDEPIQAPSYSRASSADASAVSSDSSDSTSSSCYMSEQQQSEFSSDSSSHSGTLDSPMPPRSFDSSSSGASCSEDDDGATPLHEQNLEAQPLEEPTFELAYHELEQPQEQQQSEEQEQQAFQLLSPLASLADASLAAASSAPSQSAALVMSPLALAAQPLYRLLSNGLDIMAPLMEPKQMQYLQQPQMQWSAPDYSVQQPSLHLLPPPTPLSVAARFTSETMPYYSHAASSSSLLALEAEAASLPPAVVPSAKGQWTLTAGVTPAPQLFINANASLSSMLLSSPGSMLNSPAAAF